MIYILENRWILLLLAYICNVVSSQSDKVGVPIGVFWPIINPTPPLTEDLIQAPTLPVQKAATQEYNNNQPFEIQNSNENQNQTSNSNLNPNFVPINTRAPQIFQSSRSFSEINCSNSSVFQLKQTVIQQFCDINSFDDLRSLETSEVKTCCRVTEFLLEEVHEKSGQQCMCEFDINSNFGILVDIWRLICQIEHPFCEKNQNQNKNVGQSEVVLEQKQNQNQNLVSANLPASLENGELRQEKNVVEEEEQEMMEKQQKQGVVIPKLQMTVGSLLQSVQKGNVLEAMEEIQPLKTAYNLVKQQGLANALSNKFQPMTMFVPTNDAFERFASSQGFDVATLSRMPKMQEILQYHIILGQQLIGDIDNSRTFTTWQGSNMSVRSTEAGIGQVNLYATGCCSVSNFAFIVVADAKTQHGIIHIIDNVLQPPPN